MDKLILKPAVIDKIRKDPILYGKIASVLGITPMSLPRVLASKSIRLTEALVLQVLRDYLKVSKDNELLMSAEKVAA